MKKYMDDVLLALIIRSPDTGNKQKFSKPIERSPCGGYNNTQRKKRRDTPAYGEERFYG